MSKMDFYYKSSDGITDIHANKWVPIGKPKAVLQIIHGMVEYIGRYEEFANYMSSQGYIVVGEDHLGHGKSVRKDEYHGYFGPKGNQHIIEDIHTLRKQTQSEYKKLPYFMLGHSMGSFLVRQYITEKDAEYAKGLSGVIVMGTAWQPAIALTAGKIIAALLGTRRVGATSPMLENIAFGSYLKKIENPRTPSDWITRDKKIVDKYVKDPYCTFHFTPNAFYHMFAGMQKAHNKTRISKLPKDLPILFCSGAEDPVGNYGEGVRKAYMVYSESAPIEAFIKIYDDDRHEILNELNRTMVYEDMLDFLNSCIKK